MTEERYSIYVICHEKDGLKCGPVKVGIAADPERRLTALRTGNPHKLALFWHFLAPSKEDARWMERGFHEAKQEKRMEGEWFDLDPIVATQILCLYFELVYVMGGASREQSAEFLKAARVPQAAILWQPASGTIQ